jgi:hypothetical protein
MKESNLGKFFVDILGIAPTSEDAVRLIHWKKPTVTTALTVPLTNNTVAKDTPAVPVTPWNSYCNNHWRLW